jgi:hypothetical protein
MRRRIAGEALVPLAVDKRRINLLRMTFAISKIFLLLPLTTLKSALLVNFEISSDVII